MVNKVSYGVMHFPITVQVKMSFTIMKLSTERCRIDLKYPTLYKYCHKRAASNHNYSIKYFLL